MARCVSPLTVALTALAVAIAMFRALHQNLTGDEASTYLRWVEPPLPVLWQGDTNNHLLNSLLMKATTGVLGPTPLAIRLPALAGGIALCVLSGLLVEALHGRSLRAALVYLLLVFDPFVADYLFAARGYAIAMACQMALLLLARQQLPTAARAGVSTGRLVAAGALAGAMTAASYAFIPGALAALATYWLFVIVRPGLTRGVVRSLGPSLARGVVLAAAFAVVVGGLCLHNLRTFPMDTLTWGTKTFPEMLGSIEERVFLPPGPFVAPPFSRVLEVASRWGGSAVAVVVLACGLILTLEGRAKRSDQGESGRTNAVFAAYCGVLLLATIAAFLGMVQFLHILWPLGRTALVLMAPLALFSAETALAEGESLWSRLRLGLGGGALALVALGFLASSRLDRFVEWDYDADVRQAVDVAGRYMRDRGLRKIGTTWHYKSTGNYYRAYLGYDIDPLEDDRTEELVDGYDVYFVPPGLDDFVASRGLHVLYEGPISGMRVAVVPAPRRRRAA